MNRPMPIRIVGTTIPATIAPVFELSGDGVVVANCPCKKTEFYVLQIETVNSQQIKQIAEQMSH